MENKKFEETKKGKHYHQFICVIVQYTAELNNEKLIKVLKGYQNDNCEDKVSRKGFHYRLAKEETSSQLTGYRFNSVTPFLMAEEYFN